MDDSTTASSLNLVIAKDETNIQVNGTNIILDLIDGFDECSDQQQRYLTRFATDPELKKLHAMQLGYSTSTVDRWFNEENFAKVASTINDIYLEVLKGLDFKEAITNSKIRNRVIQSKERGGKYLEDKTVNNNIINTGASFGDVMKMLQNGKSSKDSE